MDVVIGMVGFMGFIMAGSELPRQCGDMDFFWERVLFPVISVALVCIFFGIAHDWEVEYVAIRMVIALIAAFFIELLCAGCLTSVQVEKRRRGELVAVRLTKNEATRIIIDYLYPPGSLNRALIDQDDEGDMAERFQNICLRDVGDFRKLQKKLGVPLNVAWPHNVGEILRQAVRYP
ncbi:MAG: hypothetical protein Q8L11_05055 [Candidatus Moranbacteria bacterium]|nr:hypothetical protein [bacterium]MDP1834265.1 hypothetical protein [Candidatus Moranbacteria bacterium]